MQYPMKKIQSNPLLLNHEIKEDKLRTQNTLKYLDLASCLLRIWNCEKFERIFNVLRQNYFDQRWLRRTEETITWTRQNSWEIFNQVKLNISDVLFCIFHFRFPKSNQNSAVEKLPFCNGNADMLKSMTIFEKY